MSNQDFTIRFHELCFDKAMEHGTVEELLKLVKGKYVYKYRCNKDRHIKDLLNNRLSCALPKTLNDPFECTYRNELGFSGIKKADDIILNSMSVNKDSQYICSFSEVEDDILMWSHYSDSHRGFCMKYSVEKILLKHLMIIPVYYSIELPIIHYDLRYIFTKSENWAYEKEWRIYINKKDEDSETYKYILTPKPEAIFIGCNAQKELIDKLVKYSNCNIPIYKGEANKFEYKIDFNKIN